MLACRVGRGGVAAAAVLGVRWFRRWRRMVVVVVGPEPAAALVVDGLAVVASAAAAVAGRSTGLGSSHPHSRPHHHRSQFQCWCCGWRRRWGNVFCGTSRL